jgi:hypothetical protein
MKPSFTLGLRTAGITILLLTVLCFRKASDGGLRAQNAHSAPATAQEAGALSGRLVRDYPEVLDRASRSEISAGMADSGLAGNLTWRTYATRTTLTEQQVQENLEKADKFRQSAAQRFTAGLERIPGLIRLSGQAPAAVVAQSVSAPYRSAVLVVRRQVSGNWSPGFFWKKVDLGSGKTIGVGLGSVSDFIGVLELENPPQPSGRFKLQLSAGAERVANIDLTVTVPPHFPLQVKIVDGAGQPTEAAVGLYGSEKFLVPDSALDFSQGGFNYTALKNRDHRAAKFWPGADSFTRCFFVRGGFKIELPAGTYRLIASKGPQFVATDRQITVDPAKPASEKVVLRRWSNQSERGWHSGDTHIHYARADQQANRRLELWAQAEDLEMGNILRMGDARKTYFDQFAFGKAGRHIYSRGAFVPGQEDPRTGVMGHTISLNLQRPIRDPERRYYLYSTTFDESHRQGGLSGYAHANSDSFLVHRDMTLNIARHKVDFAEICEFGSVGTDLYYEFLNLGFKLTAVGGSDAPWGGTVGDSRVYAYTGNKKFDPDQWFAALKAGHTFVTAAAMLEFTVDGHLPGDEISPKKGRLLKVSARAQVGSSRTSLGRLEIVANGEVLRSADAAGTSAELSFELPADRSMWIAARAADAHTTPVYITVDGKRHWKPSEVPALLDKRLATLDELDQLIAKNWESIPQGHEAEWENRETFRQGAGEMRKMVREARDVYLKLRQETRTPEK